MKSISMVITGTYREFPVLKAKTKRKKLVSEMDFSSRFLN
jgi:hypothetical protein